MMREKSCEGAKDIAGQSAWKGKIKIGDMSSCAMPLPSSQYKRQKTKKGREYEIQRQLEDTSSCRELLRYASPRLSSIQKPPHYF